MQKDVFVSFIVPSFNASGTIVRCLNGIHDMDYPKACFELILIDNGSTDNTVVLAGKYTDKIIVDPDATIAKLRNIGAEKARGDILVFIDSDCVLPKGWLKLALEHFKDPDVGLVGPELSITPENAPWVEKTWKIHLARSSAKGKVSWLVSRVLAIKKDVFFKVGGFDGSLRTCEDVEFGYRVKRQYKIVSDEKLFYLHLGEDATLKDFFIKETWRGRSSIEVSLKNLSEFKELLSLGMLGYYLIFLFIFLPLVIAYSIVAKNMVFFAIVLSGILFPILAMTVDTCRRTGKFSYLGKLFVMYAVYIFARVVAIFR